MECHKLVKDLLPQQVLEHTMTFLIFTGSLKHFKLIAVAKLYIEMNEALPIVKWQT